MTNLAILNLLDCIPAECGGALGVPILPTPSCIPPSFTPTPLQRSTPHEIWIDTLPSAQLRDNLILAAGSYDEDELCRDVVGGLFDGYNDLEVNGTLIWADPWHVSGWEVTEGFVRKWGFLLGGCGELIEAANRWRESRHEERLIVEV